MADTFPIVVFSDGASKGNPGPGGWGVVSVTPDGQVTELGGGETHTTNNRMELTGAIEALAHLENVSGDVRIQGLPGAVGGSHRNGRLEIDDVGSASLTLVSSRADLGDIRGSVTVNARGGECKIDGAVGAVQVDQSNNELRITNAASTVRISGSGGSVLVERPGGEVSIDVRRAEVDVTIEAAVRITALTTDEPLRLELVGTPAFELDAVTTDDGTIEIDGVPVAREDKTVPLRVTRTMGASGGPRVALRNQSGEIVIRQAK